jgi:DNA-directed RNA polymerase specialized sigma subunit
VTLLARKNPVQDYLEEQEKLATERRQEDIRIWQQWKAEPTPENLDPLLDRFEPTIRQQMRYLGGAKRVRASGLESDLYDHAIKAFQTYDPSKAALNTHVTNRLKKGIRFVQMHQNMARIPEEKTGLIRPIQLSMEELKEDLGRDPFHHEIAEHLNQQGYGLRGKSGRQPITPGLVKEVVTSQRRDIMSSAFETDPTPQAIMRQREQLPLVRFALQKPEEREVFDYLHGMNGKPQIDRMGDIAKRMGKSPSQVSRYHSSIKGVMRKYQ